MKAYLAGDFAAAFDLMLFQMGRSVFTFGYKADALDITVRDTADRPTTRMNDADFEIWSPGEAMLADRSGLSMDWLEIEDDGESFAALRALPASDKKVLFAACVARTVKPQLAFEPQARPEFEATVARLDIDFASHVRPTAAMLWSRIAKARILDIARIVFGISWASARSKTKKAALADAMETAFAAGGHAGRAERRDARRGGSPGRRRDLRPSTPGVSATSRTMTPRRRHTRRPMPPGPRSPAIRKRTRPTQPRRSRLRKPPRRRPATTAPRQSKPRPRGPKRNRTAPAQSPWMPRPRRISRTVTAACRSCR